MFKNLLVEVDKKNEKMLIFLINVKRNIYIIHIFDRNSTKFLVQRYLGCPSTSNISWFMKTNGGWDIVIA